MVQRLFLSVFLIVLAVGCSSPTPPKTTVTIFAAASLTDAFEALAAEYEATHPDTDILLNFGGSSQLAVQLQDGAQADLFASANPFQIERVVDDGLILAEDISHFASNRLTVAVALEKEDEIRQLEDLAQSDLRLVFGIEGVPIRAYTDELLGELPKEIQKNIYANLVSEEDNVRRVMAKISLGEADAGIVYASDITPLVKTQLHQVDIPDEHNIIAPYFIGQLTGTPHPTDAAQFVDFLFSSEGQAILRTWGFGSSEG